MFTGQSKRWTAWVACYAMMLGLVGPSFSVEQEPTLTPEVEAAIQRGLAFLAKQKTKDGSFGNQHPVGATGIALLALLANGHLPDKGEYGKVVSDAVEFLMRHRDRMTGYLGQSMYEHGFATLALADVWGEYKDEKNELQDALEQAVQLCVQAQNKEGGWRYSPGSPDSDVSVASCVIQGLRASREAFFLVPEDVMSSAARYIRRCQARDGGFAYMAAGNAGEASGSGIARTGAGVMSLMACGFYNSPEVLRGLEYLSRRPQFDQAWPSYGAYYSVLAMYQGRTLNQKFWTEWYPKIQAQILKAQRKDGSFVFQGAGGSGGVVDTGFAIICLSIQKGYLPLFQR